MTVHTPDATFGAPAEAALDAPGGPRDPHTSPEPSNGPHTTAGTGGSATGPDGAADTASTAGGGDGATGPDGAAGGGGEAADGVVGGSRFVVSPEAAQWVQQWRPGDDHVISTALDYGGLVGLQAAVLEDGTPIPPGLLSRLVCESQLSRVVFGPESTILDAGREKRIFPANQVRAVIARDKHCQYPGCDEPPGYGEIHHSLWWAKHLGATDAEHGILLCWHHHDWVHTHQITITRSAGQWYFHDRNGWLLTAHGPDRP
ncbi:HNH endonuclease signature motif containing protein [Georgenia sp. H159]|uniref:HNH endonuclease signature motif containing protein n=1 Tax=Georgenia sp. H159 TaxID=3076115 RepID=UPI002D7A3BEE|nr:HNH endonuclease signature motif containing protein [Georgenia sp. H159]